MIAHTHLLLYPLIAAGVCSCAQVPAPLPEPPPVVVIDCRPPADALAVEVEPAPPSGETYTQRDVARYVVQLAAWARTGWAQVKAVSEFAADCDRRANGAR